MLLYNARKLRPTAAVAAAVAICVFIACYVMYDRCCGWEYRVLHCAITGIDSNSRPAVSQEATDACYHDNLLAKLGYSSRSGQRDEPFYANLLTNSTAAGGGLSSLSQGCIDALTTSEKVTNATDISLSDDEACFRTNLSPAILSEVYAQLRQLLSNFSARQLEIFISDGSLIGSVRHFGVVPWDDDLDFLIRRDQKPEVRALLDELSHGAAAPFQLYDTEAVNQHWRLGILCRTAADDGTKSCRLSLDLFFGHRAAGRWFVREEWPHAFHLADVYPLGLRPFGPDLLVPVPRRPMHFLQRQYQSDVMQLCSYQPHTATKCRRRDLPCRTVRQLGGQPFVRLARLPVPSGHGVVRNVTAELLLCQRRQLLTLFLPPVEN